MPDNAIRIGHSGRPELGMDWQRG